MDLFPIMDIESIYNLSYIDMAKAIIDRFNELLRFSERLFPFHNEDTPLLFAIRRNTGNLDEIRKLLSRGADINVVNEDGRTVLHEAVMNAYCNLGVVKLVLENEPALINRCDKLKKTALHMAMMFESYEAVVLELINRGADLNAEDLFKETPLHIAANFRHDLYKVLLDRGALIDARNCYGRTPLHCALMRQAPHLNVPLILALLSHGADVNAIDIGHNSILHYAVRNPQVKKEIIQMFLELGAVPDHRDLKKMPPLGYCKNKNISKLLIQYSVLQNLKIGANNEIIQPDKVLNLNFFTNKFDRMHWARYRGLCLKDIACMMDDKVSSDCTFFDYIFKRYNKKDVNLENTCEGIPDMVLVRFYNDAYPFCNDVIYAAIKLGELLNKLYYQPIYVMSENGPKEKIIFLNLHCIEHLAKYLSKLDLINLVLAYSLQDLYDFKEPKLEIVFKRPRPENKDCDVDDSISHIVCKKLKVVIDDNRNYETGLPFL
ncbi:uncharacterized protein [Parasteatoda tepidariorum]|uniref:uncharacterized protein n=1 Tax=Parasteatoda tepidariorum TaxID=114398 RepID=UPI001C71C1D2|nr:transient receptor potential cation channel subfamily A member 1 homolog [Parasteatoda tepidariorum]